MATGQFSGLPIPWRDDVLTAIGAVAKSGDTMTGGLAVAGPLPTVAIESTSVTVGRSGAGLPLHRYTYSGGDADAKVWEWYTNATQMVLRTMNDAYAASAPVMTMTRSGITPTSIAFGGPVAAPALAVTAANSSAVNLRSGSTVAWTAYTIGRTGTEGYLGISAGGSIFSGDAAGDVGLRAETGTLRLGIGVTPVAHITTAGVGVMGAPISGVPLTVKTASGRNLGVVDQASAATVSAFTDAGGSAPLRIVGNNLKLSGNGSTDHITLEATGNLGIGAAPGQRRLLVGGTAIADLVLKSSVASGGAGGFSNLYFGNSTSDSAGGYIGYSHATNSLTFGTSGIQRALLDSTGLTSTSTGNGSVHARSGAAASYGAFTWGRTGIEGYLGVSGGASQLFTGDAAGDTALRAEAGTLRLGIGASPTAHITPTGLGVGYTPPSYGPGMTVVGVSATTQAVYDVAVNGTRQGTLTATASDVFVGSTAARPLSLITSGGARLVIEASGAIQAQQPFRFAQYTLATLPSAAVFSGHFIDVTNATGGPKLCRSNGSVWQVANSTTAVS